MIIERAIKTRNPIKQISPRLENMSWTLHLSRVVSDTSSPKEVDKALIKVQSKTARFNYAGGKWHTRQRRRSQWHYSHEWHI
jgi:hypothetical protein